MTVASLYPYNMKELIRADIHSLGSSEAFVCPQLAKLARFISQLASKLTDVSCLEEKKHIEFKWSRPPTRDLKIKMLNPQQENVKWETMTTHNQKITL